MLTYLGLQGRDLSILFTDNRKITELNRQFFGKNCATNVISFSYAAGFGNEVLGDIIVSAEQARIESEGLEVPFYERLLALVIHGLLHVLGFDHLQGEKEARRMRYREKRLLAYVVAHKQYKEITL